MQLAVPPAPGFQGKVVTASRADALDRPAALFLHREEESKYTVCRYRQPCQFHRLPTPPVFSGIQTPLGVLERLPGE